MTRVLLVPWGDTIEDYLDPIGLDVDAMLESMSEGWLFGYVAALRAVDIDAVIGFASTTVREPRRRVHRATGAEVIVLPASRISRLLRRTVGDRGGRRWVGSAARRLATAAATALSLPHRVLAAEVARLGVDAVVVQEYEYPRFDRLVRWGRRSGVAVFGTFQGADRSHAPGEHRVRSRTLPRAAGLICASSVERNRVLATYDLPPEQVATIVNPLDLAAWQPLDREDSRQRLGLDPDAYIVVCHGRIDVHRKGLDVLLDAWQRAALEHGLLVLIGSGDGDEELVRLLGPEPSSVRWERGYMTSRSELRRWLSAADAYVSASRVEGMAVAPLEAMAMGLPAILTDLPGSLEVAGDPVETGTIVVPAGDAAALARALGALAEGGDRKARGRRARMHIETRFSTSAVGRELGAFLVDRLAAR